MLVMYGLGAGPGCGLVQHYTASVVHEAYRVKRRAIRVRVLDCACSFIAPQDSRLALVPIPIRLPRASAARADSGCTCNGCVDPYGSRLWGQNF
jgi:hypothetical protein